MRKLAVAFFLAAFHLSTIQAFGGTIEDALRAYRNGDYKTAFGLIKPLAEKGDATAQFNIGVMYAKGQGVQKDDSEAAKWYRKSAEQGDGYAQYSLGMIYKKGVGVAQDYVLAHMWYNLAASHISVSEPEGREHAAKNRDYLASIMTSAQIAEAQRMAREWKPKKGR